MAISAPSRAHRRELQTLTNMAQADLGRSWAIPANAVSARNGLARVFRTLMPVYAASAATLAADHYDNLRELAGARGRFRAAPIEVDFEDEAIETMARVAVGPLFAAEPDGRSALVLAGGMLQREVANADRETIRLASIADPRSGGWVRVGVGECDWCQQFLTGEVQATDAVGFEAHDNCNCTAEPSFE